MENEADCNDRHSRLNPVRVAQVLRPQTEREVIEGIREATDSDRAVSICGARHAMGGQQFGAATLLLDLSGLVAIGEVDRQRGLVEVGAGIKWPALIEGLHAQQEDGAEIWSIRQKQTGADDLSLGGSLSANIHGRGLTMRPFVDDVEAFTLIGPDGVARRCSRSENPELFSLAIGGYGLFGVVTSIELRLALRSKLERQVEVTTLDQLLPKLEERIRMGCQFGDFQFSIDECSPDFLWRGVLSSYRPVDEATPIPVERKELGIDDWEELIRLAHYDRAKVFKVYSEHYLATHGGIYWSDRHQLSVYLDDYHLELDEACGSGVPSSEMITELYVPRSALVEFMKRAAELLKDGSAPVIYGTVRLIREDRESFLAWAREDFACVIFNLHTEHDRQGIETSSSAFRSLIDLALAFGGSYFLTYHRWARRDQVENAHPRFVEFLAKKKQHDPEQRFQSEWWRHYRNMFEAE